jgi:hypothetical protein
VWNEDFRDQDLSASADDSYSSDSPGLAYSYVDMHGTCDDATNVKCSTDADCTTALGAGSKCPSTPPLGTGIHKACVVATARSLVTSSSANSGACFVPYGYGQYNASSGTTVFGESNYSGSWRGAGTDGGANVVFITPSCALRPPYWDEMYTIGGGAHVIATIAPLNNLHGSTANSSDDMLIDNMRGTNAGRCAENNKNASIASCWYGSLDSESSTSGGDCPNQGGSYTYGGGYGINGCGAHVVTTYGAQSTVGRVTTETWDDAKYNTLDQSGGGWYYVQYHCNYDCLTYPP